MSAGFPTEGGRLGSIDLLGLKLSCASARHCVERVARAGPDEYESIREHLPEADVVHVDEIAVSPDDEQAWLWTFITEGIRYEIATSRGSDVLEAVLGEDFDGRLVNDGWTAYPAFTDAFQRCWVHTFRVIDFLAERHPEVEGIATMHHNLYDWLLDLQEADPSNETRARMRENAH